MRCIEAGVQLRTLIEKEIESRKVEKTLATPFGSSSRLITLATTHATDVELQLPIPVYQLIGSLGTDEVAGIERALPVSLACVVAIAQMWIEQEADGQVIDKSKNGRDRKMLAAIKWASESIIDELRAVIIDTLNIPASWRFWNWDRRI